MVNVSGHSRTNARQDRTASYLGKGIVTPGYLLVFSGLDPVQFGDKFVFTDGKSLFVRS